MKKLLIIIFLFSVNYIFSQETFLMGNYEYVINRKEDNNGKHIVVSRKDNENISNVFVAEQSKVTGKIIILSKKKQIINVIRSKPGVDIKKILDSSFVYYKQMKDGSFIMKFNESFKDGESKGRKKVKFVKKL